MRNQQKYYDYLLVKKQITRVVQNNFKVNENTFEKVSNHPGYNIWCQLIGEDFVKIIINDVRRKSLNYWRKKC